jgi:transcriptional regulator GlxA family with amidase domain
MEYHGLQSKLDRFRPRRQTFAKEIVFYFRKHLKFAEDIPVEALAELVDLSPFHFSRVFKHATGMSPLQFVTRERITRAQQLIRETSRSLIDIWPGGRLHASKLFHESLSARHGRDAYRVP